MSTLQKARACFPTLLESEDLREAIIEQRNILLKLLHRTTLTSIIGVPLRDEITGVLKELQWPPRKT